MYPILANSYFFTQSVFGVYIYWSIILINIVVAIYSYRSTISYSKKMDELWENAKKVFDENTDTTLTAFNDAKKAAQFFNTKASSLIEENRELKERLRNLGFTDIKE